MASRARYSVVLVGVSSLLVLLGQCRGQASPCEVKPVGYGYRRTTTEAVQSGCTRDSSRQSYVQCTGTLPLSDGNLGPPCGITGHREEFYIFERSVDFSHNLLLTFRASISPVLIRLHYFSDPVNGIGLPTLQLYANVENPWDTVSGDNPRVADVRPLLADMSESPHRESHNISIDLTEVRQLSSLLITIRFSSGNNVASFYLSEIEVFTCTRTENAQNPVECPPTTTTLPFPVLSTVMSPATSTVEVHTPAPTSSSQYTPTPSRYVPEPTETANPRMSPEDPRSEETDCQTELAWILVYVFASLFIALLTMVILYCSWVQIKACWRQKKQIQIQQQPPPQQSEDTKIKSCDVEQPQIHHEYAVLTYLPTPEPIRRDPNCPEMYSEPHIYESVSPYHSNNHISHL